MPRLIDHDARRRGIVHAASALVAAHGLEAATIRAVAAKAEIVPGSVRYIFETQAQLVDAIAEDLVVEVRSAAAERGARYAKAGEPTMRLVESLPTDGATKLRWQVERALRGRGARLGRYVATCRQLRGEECHLVLSGIGARAGTDLGVEVLHTLALVEGLGDQLVDGYLSPDEARYVLKQHLVRVSAAAAT